ncbi:MAG TPA: ABC transporter ATP-binding protein [Trueperaceae bacterium]
MTGDERLNAAARPGMARATRRERANDSIWAAVRKMWALLSRSERKHVYLLLPMITVMALMQVVGVVSVGPFLALVANPEVVETNSLLSSVYDMLGFQSYRSFLLFAGFGALGLLLLSNAISSFTEWSLLRFSWRLNHDLSKRILERYLHKPYVFFLSNNTSRLGKNLLSEVKQLVKGFVVSGMKLVANGVVALFILGLLIAVNPLLAVMAFATLGGAYALIYAFVRKRLDTIGKQRSHYDRERFKTANEALGGAKEIKLLGKERSFLRLYSIPSKRYSRYMANHQAISTLPRYGLESVAFGGMILIVIYLLGTGQGLTRVLTLLGLYAVASYRLMPALQQTFSSLTDLRFSAPAVDLIYEDIQDADFRLPPDRDTVKPLPIERSIELRNVTYAYPASAPVLRNFDLRAEANTSVALVGSTGSGKTTTVDIILGLLEPQSGSLVVDGIEVTRENLPNWQANLGYVPQDIYLADDTIAHNIAFGVLPEKVDMAAVERAAKLANIHDFIVNELPDAYETITGERGARLSGGQRQRLGIARALYHDPSVLVLDEATSALDGATEESIFRAVSEIGKSKTVIMIAHRLATVRDCDVIYVLDNGKVLSKGSYDELLESNPEFRRLAKLNETVDERVVTAG